jgi:exosortase
MVIAGSAAAHQRDAHGPSAMSDGGRSTAFLLLLVACWPTVLALPRTWSAPYQEHGFFVAGIVAWLIVRDRGKLRLAAGEPIRGMAIPLATISALWMGGVITNAGLVHQGLFVVLLTAWAVTVYGWTARCVVLGIGLTSLLGVPFWGVTIPVLQRATVLASGGATRLLGIQAEIGETSVAITAGTFLIEEGCAGLNYLMGGLVLGAAYGHLFANRWQTQLKIVALFGGMAIVGNWIRVAALIVLGEITAMQSPYIEDHLWQGWLIFSALMVPTFLLAGRIERRDAGRRPDADSESLGVRRPVPLDRHAVWVATACTALGPILFIGLSAIPRRTDLDRDLTALRVSPEWSVQDQPAGVSWSPSFSGVDESSSWLLRSGIGEVQASRSHFLDQRQGEELIQFDNRIAPDSLVIGRRLLGPVGDARRIVNETVVMDGDAPRLVWHWYRVSGVDTSSETRAKLLEIPSFFLRLPGSELVTLTARCQPNDCTSAARALASALGEIE